MPASQRLINSLFKLAYRYSHSRRYRHNERLWPHVRVDRDADDVIQGYAYRGHEFALANTQMQAGAFDGACHVIASGPSVKDIDYGKLALSHVMGVNGAIALGDMHDVRFDYYCFNDTGFVRAHTELVRRIVTQDLLLFTTPFCLWQLLQYIPVQALRCRIFLIENPQRRAKRPASSIAQVMAARPPGSLDLFDADEALGFSHDIRHGVFDAGTVAYTALQIAVWMGFTQIFLHGVDLKDAASVPRFYESQADKLPTTLDRYLPLHILPAFTRASRDLHAAGVRIVNLSPDSALVGDFLEKRDWRTLIQ